MRNLDTQTNSFWLSKPMVLGYTLTVFIAIFWSIIFSHTPKCITEPCSTNWNTFWKLSPNEIGDTFAGLFGSLAFVWIVVTVLMQGSELRQQREESKKMANALGSQVFDNSFFSILEIHNTIVAELDNENGQRSFKGRDVFKIHHEVLLGMFQQKEGRVSSKLSIDHVSDVYDVFWYHTRGDLGHYLRYLYRAFRTLEEKNNSSSYHSKLLRAQLSDYELAILFYNCLTERGKKFRSLAVKFKIFDNLPLELLSKREHSLWVPEEAFGDNEGFKQFKLENSLS